MAETTPVIFTSQAIFEAAFPDAGLGNASGNWLFDDGGSTGSAGTGPGSNNILEFMHTETSGVSDLATAETQGIAPFADVPDQAGRILHLRMCIQGRFLDGAEGMQIQHRASDGDAWVQAGFAYGWIYDDYTAGQEITDGNGQMLTVAVNGGWVDFEILIPDTATQVRLQPRYVPGQGNAYQHDIALRQFFWEWPDPALTRDAGVSARAGSPTAAIGAQAVPITNRDAGISARAGSPTAAIGAQAVPITNRDAGISARAGSPTAAIGAQAVPITNRDAGISARAGNPTAAIGADLQPDDVASLLPPGKTPLEIALEGATAPRVSPDQIRDLWDPLKCPEPLLPWLAWALSVDLWEDDWTEAEKRAVIDASIEVHRHKGTVSAMRRVTEALGFTFAIEEWWETTPTGTPGTASVYLGRPGAPVFDQAEIDRLTALLDEAKRATLHITLSQAFTDSADLYAYARFDVWASQDHTLQTV